MTRTLPPLTWFRAFESAARHLSFTAAAGELSLTQSAISQHVRALEQRLGDRLFVRKARGVALTDAGRRLLPFVSSAIGELAAATELFGPERRAGVLSVSTRDSFAQAVLAPGLPRFVAANPDVRIRFISTLWPDDEATSRADLEIRLGTRDLVGSDARRLLADRLLPVCAPGLVAGRATVSKIYRLPLIQAVGSSDTWESWARSVHAAAPPPASQLVDSYGLALELARQGSGVALVSQLLAATSLRQGTLRAIARSAPARESFYLLRSSRRDDGLAERFERWLREEIASLEDPPRGQLR